MKAKELLERYARINEMRTKELKIQGKTIEATLMCGISGIFKIYLYKDFAIVDAGRNKLVMGEKHGFRKLVSKYISLPYQKKEDQPVIEKEMRALAQDIKDGKVKSDTLE